MKVIVSIKDLNWIEEMSELMQVVLFSEEFHGTQSAHNFSKEEIKEGIKRAQTQECMSAVLMNRMYTDEELDEAKQYMIEMDQAQVDWFYYQDPAIYMIAKELNLEGKLVYDPDTLLTNSNDVKVIQELGIHHGVISKEITKDEMIEILRKVQGKSEVIGFGYLKLSTSKRKLIQSYCDEVAIQNTMRNSQEGYLIESTREGKMPIVEDEQGTHIYTDYVLCALEEISDFMSADLEWLRVESHFIEKEVIHEFLKSLRQVIDGVDATKVKDEFTEKYPELPWSSGYMYQKTNLVK